MILRASADAWRTAGPHCGMENEPAVVPSFGLERRVAGDHLHAGEIDVEFIGADLRDGREDALSQFDLADQESHALVGVDANPRAEHCDCR